MMSVPRISAKLKMASLLLLAGRIGITFTHAGDDQKGTLNESNPEAVILSSSSSNSGNLTPSSKSLDFGKPSPRLTLKETTDPLVQITKTVAQLGSAYPAVVNLQVEAVENNAQAEKDKSPKKETVLRDNTSLTLDSGVVSPEGTNSKRKTITTGGKTSEESTSETLEKNIAFLKARCVRHQRICTQANAIEEAHTALAEYPNFQSDAKKVADYEIALTDLCAKEKTYNKFLQDKESTEEAYQNILKVSQSNPTDPNIKTALKEAEQDREKVNLAVESAESLLLQAQAFVSSIQDNLKKTIDENTFSNSESLNSVDKKEDSAEKDASYDSASWSEKMSNGAKATGTFLGKTVRNASIHGACQVWERQTFKISLLGNLGKGYDVSGFGGDAGFEVHDIDFGYWCGKNSFGRLMNPLRLSTGFIISSDKNTGWKPDLAWNVGTIWDQHIGFAAQFNVFSFSQSNYFHPDFRQLNLAWRYFPSLGLSAYGHFSKSAGNSNKGWQDSFENVAITPVAWMMLPWLEIGWQITPFKGNDGTAEFGLKGWGRHGVHLQVNANNLLKAYKRNELLAVNRKVIAQHYMQLNRIGQFNNKVMALRATN